MKQNTLFLMFFSLLTYFASTLGVGAVIPAPDGGYPGGNTAEGQGALFNLTTGSFNTAVGYSSLRSAVTGQLNTAVGAGGLFVNTADQNTAIGAAALLSNTTGLQNTANGTFALFDNTTGSHNTAVGANALFHNTGSSNTAIGDDTLLSNSTGQFNIAIGDSAGANSTGDSNIVIGTGAGNNITTASNVICISTSGENVNNTCYIANIFSAANAGGTAVFVNSDGQLHVATSSLRFKDDIKGMDKASEELFALKPVTFHYKKQIDPVNTLQFGLVAEEVAKVDPSLVVPDKEGKPYTVRYDAVNAMLLNEFLKTHKKMEEQEVTIAQLKKELEATAANQRKEIESLTAGLQRISARLELNKLTPLMVENRD